MSASPFEHVQVEGDEVAVVTFDSGKKLNVFTLELLRDLQQVVRGFGTRRPRAVVFVGNEDRFSAGMSVDDALGLSPAQFREFVELEYSVFGEVERLGCATVAALSGPCIGNAAEFALACDYRVATPGVRFGLPEVAIGFAAPTQRILRYLSFDQARDFLLRSRIVTGDEAFELGLVNEVTTEGSPLPAAMRLAGSLAALAPMAVELTKKSLFAQYAAETHRDTLEIESSVRAFASDDTHEGMAAFLERRQPIYRGQ
ncbi:hypothetical protein BHE97_16310 [Aeromicrobium sp. PE09-221]|uniref:enoyl-CoA hydratase/isomerase family protein n=1 Tax=Aeromicrobium sp. PE09-221 TaxID=1898043 RepID=UPI000B3EABC2|nr:enoyl-CoA hydratase/isomerase family protein [Aeromicrobium sp. PE09-221]OUZ07658.1 hypothetical protein BHE97_16310 [Aeromicrobium sp. PE09-221]